MMSPVRCWWWAGESDAACLERAMTALGNGFIPAANWLGIQAGYVFKCSEFGLGYYRDTESSNVASARSTHSGLSAEEKRAAWQFAEGCEMRLRGANSLSAPPRELSESEAAILQVRLIQELRSDCLRMTSLAAAATAAAGIA